MFVDPHSTEEIRKGEQRLINERELRQNFIEGGQKNIARFNSKVIAEQYLELYKNIAEN